MSDATELRIQRLLDALREIDGQPHPRRSKPVEQIIAERAIEEDGARQKAPA